MKFVPGVTNLVGSSPGGDELWIVDWAREKVREVLNSLKYEPNDVYTRRSVQSSIAVICQEAFDMNPCSKLYGSGYNIVCNETNNPPSAIQNGPPVVSAMIGLSSKHGLKYYDLAS